MRPLTALIKVSIKIPIPSKVCRRTVAQAFVAMSLLGMSVANAGDKNDRVNTLILSTSNNIEKQKIELEAHKQNSPSQVEGDDYNKFDQSYGVTMAKVNNNPSFDEVYKPTKSLQDSVEQEIKSEQNHLVQKVDAWQVLRKIVSTPGSN